MKKTRLLTLLVLIAAFTLLFVIGCQREEKVSAISLKDHDPNDVIEMAVGNFNYDAHKLVVAYESGSTEEIALTENMIKETDLFKFHQVGVHEITLTYENQTYMFKVDVKRSSFDDVKFPENNVFTYDGKEHVVEVEGNIPANAVVTYLGGNSFVNAGTYDVTATVSCEGYVTLKLSTVVKIEKAKYDMSEVRFESKEIVYDGNSHSIAISGTLPKGVSLPAYFIDGIMTASVADAGEYKVIARFENNDPNYEAIPDMEATMKITPAEYTVKGVDIVFKDEDGKVIDGVSKVYDGTSVSFDLNDYNKLSSKLTVAFSVSDEAGNVISTSNRITNIQNAGIYTVKVEFTLADNKNYQPIEPIIRQFEVAKKEHPPLESIQFKSKQTTYDARNGSSLAIEGQLPEGVTVSYEYYLGSMLVVDGNGNPRQSVSDVGIYVVKAVFEHTDGNLGRIPDMYASLSIKKQEVDTSMVGFFGEDSIVYNGQDYTPPFTNWKTISGTDYDLLQYTPIKYYMYDIGTEQYIEMEAGELPRAAGYYRFTVTISIAEEYKANCVLRGDASTQTIVKQFEIKKQEVALPTIDFASPVEREYTGVREEIQYTCTADTTLTSIRRVYYKYTAGEYVAMPNDVIPTDVGTYRCVVTVTINDMTSYVFENDEVVKEASFDFQIKPQTIEVDGIGLIDEEFTYDGLDHSNCLANVPSSVLATVHVFTGGRNPVSEAINVGTYRVEVTLAPASSNYVLSSNEMLVFEFEIVPMTIQVENLSFDSLTFDYNGSEQHPTLVGLPSNVRCITSFMGQNAERPIDRTVNAGKYTISVRLVAENSNYVLSGTLEYSAEFVIRTLKIDVNELLKTEINLAYTEEGYVVDGNLCEAIGNAIFGELAQYIEIQMGTPKDLETDSYLVGQTQLTACGSYEGRCLIRVIGVGDSDGRDRYNYTFIYNDRNDYLEIREVPITFNIVNQ